MKKLAVYLLMLLLALLPLTARTAKEAPDKTYIGLSAGYNGVRDSLPALIAKVVGVVMAEGMTGGHADTEGTFVEENALALGLDLYFELGPAASLSITGGCSVDFSRDGGIYPAPYGDMFVWGRMNGGTRGDFLMGAGVGSYNVIKPGNTEGYVAILLGMRYQLDIMEHMGWWTDLYTGWNFMTWTDTEGVKFLDGITVMPGLRTGLSYAF